MRRDTTLRPMSLPAFEQSCIGFVGDFSVAADGLVDGFCGDPRRDRLRCFVEILVEDRLAATSPARTPRDDLAERGFDDTGHGFRIALPPDCLPPWPELLVWARVKGARRGFAQRLLIRPGRPPRPLERERALAGELSSLSQALENVCRRPPRPPAETVREALRGLSRALSGAVM